VKTVVQRKKRFEKYEKCEWDYALFPWDFLPSVGTTAGAAFDAGATTFFSLFDVVITSFSVIFHFVVCHLFMFFWCRDIRFVPVQEFKRF